MQSDNDDGREKVGRELSTDEAASDVVKKTAASCFSRLLFTGQKSK